MDNYTNLMEKAERNRRLAIKATAPLYAAAANLTACAIPLKIIMHPGGVHEYVYDAKTQDALKQYQDEILRIFDSYMRI